MKKNVGGMDRIVRLVIGPILVLAGVAGYAGLLGLAVGPLPQALTSVIVFLVGAILLVTALVQKCPLNRVLGFNTYRQKESGESEKPTVTNPK
ncbi:DUF2892 domain-containing protein [Halapricum sp. CBA1109]|uniref:YgaP family membrane protein n=1 Tax=Halapricum sp. CBA1109 TaxID=2668068 RepID=UPI0012FCB625|nr:DUF2892 domain-containing protein [Halapricum sp. CBA1109]MUV88848.1 DUF2892 domain-containing protein [Halapricum sp. CBA1109]